MGWGGGLNLGTVFRGLEGELRRGLAATGGIGLVISDSDADPKSSLQIQRRVVSTNW